MKEERPIVFIVIVVIVAVVVVLVAASYSYYFSFSIDVLFLERNINIELLLLLPLSNWFVPTKLNSLVFVQCKHSKFNEIFFLSNFSNFVIVSVSQYLVVVVVRAARNNVTSRLRRRWPTNLTPSLLALGLCGGPDVPTYHRTDHDRASLLNGKWFALSFWWIQSIAAL